MITYRYACRTENCFNEFEAEQSIKDNSFSLCQVCGQHNLYRVIQGGMCAFDTTPHTVGALADRNTKYALQMHVDRTEAEKEKRLKHRLNNPVCPGATPIAPANKSDMICDPDFKLSDIKDVNKYIKTGEKN